MSQIPTLMGVYHLGGEEGLTTGGGLGGGRGMMGSSTSSGIVTVAFLAFSSLDPSSVDPFWPHLTFRKWVQWTRVKDFTKKKKF